jgi:hypothetical protein
MRSLAQKFASRALLRRFQIQAQIQIQNVDAAAIAQRPPPITSDPPPPIVSSREVHFFDSRPARVVAVGPDGQWGGASELRGRELLSREIAAHVDVTSALLQLVGVADDDSLRRRAESLRSQAGDVRRELVEGVAAEIDAQLRRRIGSLDAAAAIVQERAEILKELGEYKRNFQYQFDLNVRRSHQVPQESENSDLIRVNSRIEKTLISSLLPKTCRGSASFMCTES